MDINDAIVKKKKELEDINNKINELREKRKAIKNELNNMWREYIKQVE